jgi:hypothetical protein
MGGKKFFSSQWRILYGMEKVCVEAQIGSESFNEVCRFVVWKTIVFISIFLVG